jgi:hypothetical protein
MNPVMDYWQVHFGTFQVPEAADMPLSAPPQSSAFGDYVWLTMRMADPDQPHSCHISDPFRNCHERMSAQALQLFSRGYDHE